ncbi:MAG: Hpt domain-containing protein [Lachnospiraceae bacterium]|nr:Hpt domain-containing protein [Lachnospiraceae bacterium]
MEERLFKETDGIDESSCLLIYEGSYDFYIQVLETFRKEIGKTMPMMELSLGEKNWEDYRILVHGLKGSGGSAGATFLVELATQSNQLIRQGKTEMAEKLHAPIMKELERLYELIGLRLSEWPDKEKK